jgi:hypothetical protein
MELPELVRRVWEDDTCTLKEVRGLAVREYIADISGGQDTYTAGYVPKPKVELTPEQESFVMQNMGSMKPIEITAIMFGAGRPDGWRPSFNSKEYKAVTDFIQAKAPDAMDQGEIPVEDVLFKPPQSIMVLVGWANRFIPTGDPNRSVYTVKNGGLKPQDENNLRALMAAMKTVRFILQASQYEKMNERDLFVSTFMQFCHDKPDLTQEEIHQYIQAAAETVNIMQIEKYIQRLNNAVEEDVIDSTTGDKKKRPSLAVIEMMNKSRANLEDAKERLKKLLTTLVGTRADRMSNQVQAKQSIIPLINAWKNEEKRLQLIAIAEREKVEDANEVERLSKLEDIQTLIAGLTREEAME